jgi:hypothetical protein
MTLPQFALGLIETMTTGLPPRLAEEPGEQDVDIETIEHCPEDSSDLLQVLKVHTSDGKVWRVVVVEEAAP